MSLTCTCGCSQGGDEVPRSEGIPSLSAKAALEMEENRESIYEPGATE